MILVLGGGGMLGHKMFQVLGQRSEDVWCTLRSARDQPPWRDIPMFQTDRVLDKVDASRPDHLDAVLQDLRPAVVINCIGAIKQRPEGQDAVTSITLNALLPHRLAALADGWGGRVIHFSTDCVFMGARGHYTETDPPDAADMYGRAKCLGEVSAHNVLVLRTSFIGRELQRNQSLLEWFLAHNHSTVRGFRRVWWSGVTSNHLAEVVADLVDSRPELAGLYHLSSGRISKYDLLVKLRDGLGLDIEVEPDEHVELDRSLDGSHFAKDASYQCPPWESLIAQLVSDPTPYEAWANRHEIPR